jgi:hypothetical protein
MRGTRPGIDRRSAIKKAAVAGALVWATPVILSGTAYAGVFTPKCVPPTPTSGTTASTPQCNDDVDLSGDITITLATTCPCGGTYQVCAKKTGASSSAGTFTVPFHVTKTGSGGTWVDQAGTQSGKVAVSCADGSGDRQWSIYNYSFKSGLSGTAKCSGSGDNTRVTFNPTNLGLSLQSTVQQSTCPL